MTARKIVPKEIELTLQDWNGGSKVELRLDDEEGKEEKDTRKIEYKSYIIKKNIDTEGERSSIKVNDKINKINKTKKQGLNYTRSQVKKKNKSVVERRPRNKRRRQREALDPVIEEHEEKKPETGSNPNEFYETTQVKRTNISIDAFSQNTEIMSELSLLKSRLKTVFKSLSQERSPASQKPPSAFINLQLPAQ